MNCQRPEAMHYPEKTVTNHMDSIISETSVQIIQLEEQLSSVSLKNPIINEEIALEAETANELILALSATQKYSANTDDLDWDCVSDEPSTITSTISTTTT